MGYIKAAEVLPTHLLEELQQYFDGGILYVPKKSKRESWGTLSGTKQSIEERNKEILDLYEDGKSIDELADMFYLSIESIRKIIYKKK